MKVIEQGKTPTAELRCPTCKALLEVEPQECKRECNDPAWSSYHFGPFTFECKECGGTVKFFHNDVTNGFRRLIP